MRLRASIYRFLSVRRALADVSQNTIPNGVQSPDVSIFATPTTPRGRPIYGSNLFRFLLHSLSVLVATLFGSCCDAFRFLLQPLSALVATPFGSCCNPFRFLLQPLSVLVPTPFGSCCNLLRFLWQPLSVLVATPFGSCCNLFRFLLQPLSVRASTIKAQNHNFQHRKVD